MIGRCAFGRAPLLAWKSFPARGSFGSDHRCYPYIDAVNIRLTGVAFAGRHIFTLSILGGAIQARGRLSRASNIAIATRFRDPGHAPNPRTGFARGRFFTSRSRPQRCRGISSARSPLAAALRAARIFRTPIPEPGHLASRRQFASMPYRGHTLFILERQLWSNPAAPFSRSLSTPRSWSRGSIVAVHGGGHRPLSGIHWRSGVIVTAEEVLECDENIKLTLPAGRIADASLAGRDPTTDVAVLRFQPDGLPVATTADASLRAGQVVMAVGNHDGGPLAALGIVALVGGSWHSVRGGTIDSLIRLDLALSPTGEGGALIDLQGRVIGMTVLGPRRRALSIPSSTIDRAVDQLLARGHVFRGYLGAGLQPMKQERASGGSQASRSHRGVLVVSIDPNGPSARAGILVGDIVTAWNGQPIERVREIMRLLAPESIGSTVDLELIRGGAPAALRVVIGERPVA